MNGIYIAGISEQNAQQYEEVSIIMDNPHYLVAGANYYMYLKWEQEADGGIADFSPLLNRVESQVQWTDDLLRSINWDLIGRMEKRYKDNA